MEPGVQSRESHCMTHAYTSTPQITTRSAIPPPAHGMMLTRTDFHELADELDRLRATHRADLAERLRDARSFGSPGDDDDWLTVMEDAAVERGRIAQLERLIATARVVDDPPSSDAGAGLGAVVRVRDDRGRTREYELVGRLGSGDDLSQVSLRSPVGRALLGTRADDVVHVSLPSGRQRSLQVLGVRGTGPVERAAA